MNNKWVKSQQKYILIQIIQIIMSITRSKSQKSNELQIPNFRSVGSKIYDFNKLKNTTSYRPFNRKSLPILMQKVSSVQNEKSRQEKQGWNQKQNYKQIQKQIQAMSTNLHIKLNIDKKVRKGKNKIKNNQKQMQTQIEQQKQNGQLQNKEQGEDNEWRQLQKLNNNYNSYKYIYKISNLSQQVTDKYQYIDKDRLGIKRKQIKVVDKWKQRYNNQNSNSNLNRNVKTNSNPSKNTNKEVNTQANSKINTQNYSTKIQQQYMIRKKSSQFLPTINKNVPYIHSLNNIAHHHNNKNVIPIAMAATRQKFNLYSNTQDVNGNKSGNKYKVNLKYIEDRSKKINQKRQALDPQKMSQQKVSKIFTRYQSFWDETNKKFIDNMEAPTQSSPSNTNINPNSTNSGLIIPIPQAPIKITTNTATNNSPSLLNSSYTRRFQYSLQVQQKLNSVLKYKQKQTKTQVVNVERKSKLGPALKNIQEEQLLERWEINDEQQLPEELEKGLKQQLQLQQFDQSRKLGIEDIKVRNNLYRNYTSNLDSYSGMNQVYGSEKVNNNQTSTQAIKNAHNLSTQVKRNQILRPLQSEQELQRQLKLQRKTPIPM